MYTTRQTLFLYLKWELWWQLYAPVLAHLTPVTWTFDPMTPNSKAIYCCQWRMCGKGLRKLGHGVLELLVGNGCGIFDPGDLDLWPSDTKFNKVPLLPRTDVWTKFEKGRSIFLEYTARISLYRHILKLLFTQTRRSKPKWHIFYKCRAAKMWIYTLYILN